MKVVDIDINDQQITRLNHCFETLVDPVKNLYWYDENTRKKQRCLNQKKPGLEHTDLSVWNDVLNDKAHPSPYKGGKNGN